jgi:hypothetical protein
MIPIHQHFGLLQVSYAFRATNLLAFGVTSFFRSSFPVYTRLAGAEDYYSETRCFGVGGPFYPVCHSNYEYITRTR